MFQLYCHINTESYTISIAVPEYKNQLAVTGILRTKLNRTILSDSPSGKLFGECDYICNFA